MKYTLRVATPQQYCYIEAEYEGTAEEAVAEYDRLRRAVGPGEGLPHKEWCKVLDSYVSTGTVENGAEVWESMNQYQRDVIQDIKRCMKRLETNK